MKVVIVNCFDTYESRVDMLYRFFTDQGDQAEVYTSAFRHFKKCERLDDGKGYHLVKTRSYRRNLSAARIFSHMKFAGDVRRIVEAREAEIDLLWVMVPPNSLVKQFAKWKKRHPYARMIFDVIDVWPETMPFHGLETLPPIQYWRRLRDRYLQYADHVVTECELFRRTILGAAASDTPRTGAISPDRMGTLYFAKQSVLGEADIENTEGCLADDCMALCYLGSINNIVDIETISSVIAQLRQWKTVKLHVIGDGERREEMIAAAEAAGAEVVFHGAIYDAVQKQNIFAGCHFGLNIMKDSVCVGLTMKSIDYFEAGLPMINNIKGDTWDILEREQFGLNYPFQTEQAEAVCGDAAMRKRIRSFFTEHFSEDAFRRHLKGIVK